MNNKIWQLPAVIKVRLSAEYMHFQSTVNCSESYYFLTFSADVLSIVCHGPPVGRWNTLLFADERMRKDNAGK